MLAATNLHSGTTSSHPGSELTQSRTKAVRELTIGRKLRELREQHNLTQQDMADKAGVPRTYISRIENARLLPGPVMLRRIAEALQVEILDLLPATKATGAARDLPPQDDPYWACISANFEQLQPEQMSQVLEHIRGMLAGAACRNFTTQAVAAAV